MFEYKKIDFEKIWQYNIDNKDGYLKERALNDEVENSFWQNLAQNYDNKPTLYDYGKKVFELISNNMKENGTLLEIGPGTGKFTIPFSKKCRKIFAVDFSQDMLTVLKNKAKNLEIDNIKTIVGKFENVVLNKTDYILSVNSLYRIYNIKNALIKMNELATEKVFIVRTIQKPLFNELYIQLGMKDKTSLDYIYIQNILYTLNIHANVNYIDVENEVEFKDKKQVYNKIYENISEKDINLDIIYSFIDKNLILKDSRYIYKNKLKVAIIYWNAVKN